MGGVPIHDIYEAGAQAIAWRRFSRWPFPTPVLPGTLFMECWGNPGQTYSGFPQDA